VTRQLAGNGVVMVFTKVPVPGSTKTRLIPALGPQGAARLHKRLIQRTLSTVGQIEGVDVELWCTPSTLDPFLISCGRHDDIPLIDQCGDDLGARMHNAFKDTLHRAPWAILIGTDVPALEKTDITRAILDLQSGTDAVIGPAVDGGYYLLGLRKSSSHCLMMYLGVLHKYTPLRYRVCGLIIGHIQLSSGGETWIHPRTYRILISRICL